MDTSSRDAHLTVTFFGRSGNDSPARRLSAACGPSATGTARSSLRLPIHAPARHNWPTGGARSAYSGAVACGNNPRDNAPARRAPERERHIHSTKPRRRPCPLLHTARCRRACPPPCSSFRPTGRLPSRSTTTRLTAATHVCARGPGARVRAAGSSVLKHHHRRPKGSAEFVDSEFAQALGGGTSDRYSSGKQAERKTRQFCRQVQRALNLALADRYVDEHLNDLFVEDVSAAPDCGHLLVHVIAPPDRSLNDVLVALRRDTPRLRSEVAAAITRKRAPELSFVPAGPEGGDDE